MEGIENTWWVPQKGDIVRIKKLPPIRSFDEQARQIAIRELGLTEGNLYEVVAYVQDEHTRGLSVREVKNFQYIAGKRTAQIVRTIQGTPSLDFFEPVPEYNRKK